MPSTAETLPPASPLKLVCSELWGGNRPVHRRVELPGLRGVLYSQPCGGGRGGDVHYLSVCGSGVFSRLCLADVAGHGETVAAISGELHRHMRRAMNSLDQRKVLRDLNANLEALGLHAMTTAAAVTYYPPSRSLSFSYAGHPPGWVFRRATNVWNQLTLAETRGTTRLTNAPMGIEADADFTRQTIKAEQGDRFLLVTDGVLEAPDANGSLFGVENVERVLRANAGGTCDDIARALLAALTSHCGRETLTHDDVTFLVTEIVPGPKGSHFWLALKNRLLRPRGNSGDLAVALAL
ncbi:MAG: serine/threonine-protein phosphatase [Planctomycetes bacterium]|nr:serine/threonine-protein phosphatase [Planctomycetota bacterium]